MHNERDGQIINEEGIKEKSKKREGKKKLVFDNIGDRCVSLEREFYKARDEEGGRSYGLSESEGDDDMIVGGLERRQPRHTKTRKDKKRQDKLELESSGRKLKSGGGVVVE